MLDTSEPERLETLLRECGLRSSDCGGMTELGDVAKREGWL
jgi:hypothetical protein